MNASRHHDAVVVGSGFGGAVLACRLAEADRSVLVLERGREWAVDDYPSVSGTNWIWSAERPERENGWIDLRAFRNVAVVQGAGVGGGSLAYANVSIEAEATSFAGGWPVGTTEILLRSRDVFGTLGRLSECLGRGWSANGDFLSLAFYPTRSISATRGPTATAAISFLDGSIGDQSFFVEDGGFPDLVGQALREMGRGHPRLCSLFPPLGKATGSRTPLQSIMPWLGQGMDASNGTLLLARRKAPAGGWKLDLDWHPESSRRSADAQAEVHRKLSRATGGMHVVPPSWSVARYVISPHPLGGARMADSAAEGVVDQWDEAFEHPGLFVVDGAAIPRPLGLNPSRTIAALAERIAARRVAVT